MITTSLPYFSIYTRFVMVSLIHLIDSEVIVKGGGLASSISIADVEAGTGGGLASPISIADVEAGTGGGLAPSISVADAEAGTGGGPAPFKSQSEETTPIAVVKPGMEGGPAPFKSQPGLSVSVMVSDAVMGGGPASFILGDEKERSLSLQSEYDTVNDGMIKPHEL